MDTNDQRTVPLPKFWPGDPVEVKNPKSRKGAWINGTVNDARYSVRLNRVSYLIDRSDNRNPTWIWAETDIRARESE